MLGQTPQGRVRSFCDRLTVADVAPPAAVDGVALAGTADVVDIDVERINVKISVAYQL